MEEFIKEIMNEFDFAYMFAVNIATYIIIKSIDNWNGNRVVPTWLKRVISLITGISIGIIVCLNGSNRTTILYSFILSLISWDIVYKPILNYLGDKVNYNTNKK